MLVIIFIILFTLITIHRYTFGVALFLLLLPTYLIRFSLGPLPTTLLETMFFALCGVAVFRLATDTTWKKTIKYNLQHLSKKQYTLVAATTLFILGATVNMFFATDIRAALGEWKAFYIEPIVFFLLLLAMPRTEQDDKLLITALLASGLATGALTTYQHFTGWMVPWDFWQNRNTFRVTGWYGFPNAVGLYLGPLVILAMSYFLITFNKLKKINWQTTIYFLFLLATIIAGLFGVVFAKSTGAIIGITAGIGVLFLAYKSTRPYALTVGILGLIALFLLPNDHTIRQELLMQDRSGQLRLNMWAETIELLEDRPFTGAGLASYSDAIYPYRIDKWIEVFHHPHNIFLTMWVNIGLLGLIGFTWIIVWFYRALMTTHHNKYRPLFLSVLTCILVIGLVDSPYIKNDLAMLFWFFPALFLSIEARKQT